MAWGMNSFHTGMMLSPGTFVWQAGTAPCPCPDQRSCRFAACSAMDCGPLGAVGYPRDLRHCLR